MSQKSQFRTVQAILRGMLHDSEVVKVIGPQWDETGLFESPEANHIAQAAIQHYADYNLTMGDSSAWLDSLSKKVGVSADEIESTESLWQNVVAGKATKAASVIAKAEEYFDQVQIRRLLERVENLSDKGLIGKAQEQLREYQPINLKSRGHLRPAREEDIVLMQYLYRPMLAYGYITLLEGESGMGKSTILADLTARIANGWTMPPKDAKPTKKRKPKNVLYITPEDGDDMFLPRLKAAGYKFDDDNHVFLWPHDLQRPKIPRDIELFRAMIEEYNIKFIVFDPIISLMEDEYSDANASNHVRRLMDALNLLAQQTRVSFLGVRHFTKAKNSNGAVHRGAGSGAWTHACRFQYFTAKHPERDGEYVLVPSKVNTVKTLAEHTLRYRLDSAHVVMPNGSMQSYGRVVWMKINGRDIGRSADEWMYSKNKRTI